MSNSIKNQQNNEKNQQNSKTNKPRKVFLSFLGMGNYQFCDYYFEDKVVKDVKFVQEAIIQIFCKDFDVFYFFLTDGARSKNWSFENGLKKQLDDLQKQEIITGQIAEVSILDGKSENEIWDIFSKIYDNLQKNDEIVVDITHGFRSLPMLLVTLLNYAHLLKNITVQGIYYGAYEARKPNSSQNLKTTNKNTNQKPQKEECESPIFDLTSFYELQLWTNAAEEFIRSGNVNLLNEIIKNKKSSIFKSSTSGLISKNIAKDLDKVVTSLKTFTLNILTIRGMEILKGSVIKNVFSNLENLKKIINNLQNQQSNNYSIGFILKPFAPLLDVIYRKIQNFKTNSCDPGNFKTVVKWCIDHDLIPQGYTFLQEGFITTVLVQIYGCDDSKILKKNYRTFITSLAAFIEKNNLSLKRNSNNLLEELHKLGFKTDLSKTEQLDLLIHLLNNEFFIEKYGKMSDLTDTRNDMNHAGFRVDYLKTDKLKNKLSKLYENIYGN